MEEKSGRVIWSDILNDWRVLSLNCLSIVDGYWWRSMTDRIYDPLMQHFFLSTHQMSAFFLCYFIYRNIHWKCSFLFLILNCKNVKCHQCCVTSSFTIDSVCKSDSCNWQTTLYNFVTIFHKFMNKKTEFSIKFRWEFRYFLKTSKKTAAFNLFYYL